MVFASPCIHFAALAISVATLLNLMLPHLVQNPASCLFIHHHWHFWKYIHVVQRLSVYLALIKHLDLRYHLGAPTQQLWSQSANINLRNMPNANCRRHRDEMSQKRLDWDDCWLCFSGFELLPTLHLLTLDLFTNTFGRKSVQIIITRSRRHAVKKCIVSFQSLCWWLLW